MARILRHIDLLTVANLSLLVLYPVAWFAPLLRAGVLPLFGLKEISVLSGLAALWDTDVALALVVTALALPRARYFLSGFLRKILPFGLIGYLIGVFWTVPYKFADKRRQIFQRAESTLRETGDSVYLSPEGGRICSGEIGHFNRGAFHLATNLKVDICPIFVHIPTAMDAGMNLVSESGVVDVYFLPRISTSEWTLGDLDENRDAVRQVYVDFHSTLKHRSQTGS